MPPKTWVLTICNVSKALIPIDQREIWPFLVFEYLAKYP